MVADANLKVTTRWQSENRSTLDNHAAANPQGKERNALSKLVDSDPESSPRRRQAPMGTRGFAVYRDLTRCRRDTQGGTVARGGSVRTAWSGHRRASSTPSYGRAIRRLNRLMSATREVGQ